MIRNDLIMTTAELRTRLQLTQGEFARLVGADIRSVSRWERERAKPAGGARVVIAVLGFFLENRPEIEAEFQLLMSRYASLGGHFIAGLYGVRGS